jgi:hypothetical protein
MKASPGKKHPKTKRKVNWTIKNKFIKIGWRKAEYGITITLL